MIDIETLSTAHNAAIIEIAAVAFDMEGKLGSGLHAEINPNSSIAWGLKMDFETLKWHTENSVNPPWNGKAPLENVLLELNIYLNEQKQKAGKELMIWANSPSFDLVILKNAYTAIGSKPGWNYWQERDMRTVMQISPQKEVKLKNSHKALADCENQIKHLVTAINKLNLKDL